MRCMEFVILSVRKVSQKGMDRGWNLRKWFALLLGKIFYIWLVLLPLFPFLLKCSEPFKFCSFFRWTLQKLLSESSWFLEKMADITRSPKITVLHHTKNSNLPFSAFLSNDWHCTQQSHFWCLTMLVPVGFVLYSFIARKCNVTTNARKCNM